MKTIWKYTISPWLDNLVDDESLFNEDLIALGQEWYFYPHIFNEDWRIAAYWAIILVWWEERILDIDKIYRIKPNYVLTHVNTKEKHLVFELSRWVSKWDFERLSYCLSFLYNSKSIDYHFYSWNLVSGREYTKQINTKLISFLTSFFFLLTQWDKQELEMTKNNFELYQEANKIWYEKALTLLREPLIDIDSINNIHLKYWFLYNYVLNYFSSQTKTFEFFNKHFWLDFEIQQEEKQELTTEWVLILESAKFFSDWGGYYSLCEKWQKKVLTDFYIKVYYKIISKNWAINYVVSLTEGISWIETEKIFWCNTTWSTAFADYIQKYWNYHYFWTGLFIKELHKKITETKHIPVITSIEWFGKQDKYWIIIFKNWIWDLEEKIFTEKKSEDKYYFNYDFSWYHVTDKQWNDLIDIVDEWVPKIDATIVDMTWVHSFMNSLYKDDTWDYLLYLSFWMFWYMAFWDIKTPFPLIFSRWTTWSGKTSFNNILQKVWGIKKAWLDFWNSSVFTMTVLLSNLIKFPYFLWEYRENIDQVKSKVWILRSVFDKSWQTKWRADQTLIKYDYYAMPIIDWEEMINDWAVRTRTIQKQFLHQHRIEWNFTKIYRDWQKILDWVLYTYLLKSKSNKYNYYVEEWFDIFKNYTSENRVAENMSMIYAWCMCFDSSKQENYIKVLSKICDFQQNDFEKNSTSMQIIKVLSLFLSVSKMYTNPVSIMSDKSWVIIDWLLFETYMSRQPKSILTLKIDSYKEHLQALWFPVDFYDVWTEMIYWVFIPVDKILKNFLVNPDIYSFYKWYKLSNPTRKISAGK